MITDAEVKNMLVEIVTGSDLEKMVSGTIAKTKIPISEDKEDIVISIIDGDNEHFQEVFARVNIYVPNLPMNKSTIEDTERTEELSKAVVKLFDRCSNDKYLIRVDKQRVLEVKDVPMHVIFTRLLITLINF